MFIQYKPTRGRSGSTWICPWMPGFCLSGLCMCLREWVFTYRCLVGMFLIWWISEVVHFYDRLFLVLMWRVLFMCFLRLCVVCDLDLRNHAFHKLNMNSTLTHDFDVCRVLWFWTFCFLILLHISSAVMDTELHILNSVSTLVCFRLLVFLYSGLGLGL